MAIQFPQLKKTPKASGESSVSLASPYAAPTASIESYSNENVGQYNDSKFYSASGRIGRIRYLMYPMGFTLVAMLIFGVVLMAMGGFSALAGGSDGLPMTVIILVIILFIALFYINIVCAIRRLNDLNRSGWMSLLLFVPVISNFFPFYLMLAPGDVGYNDYGLPSPPPTTLMKVLTFLMFGGVMLIAIGAAIALPAYQEKAEAMQEIQEQMAKDKANQPTPTAQPTDGEPTTTPVVDTAPTPQPSNPDMADLDKPLIVDKSQAPTPSENNTSNEANFAQPTTDAPADTKKSGKISDEEFAKLSEGKIYSDPVHAKK